VRPGRNSANQHQDQNDQQYGSQAHEILLEGLSSTIESAAGFSLMSVKLHLGQMAGGNLRQSLPGAPVRPGQQGRSPGHRQIPGRMEHQDSYGCRGCSNGRNVLAVAGPGARFEKLDTMFLGFLSFVLVADGLRLC
jgi:hypothetical protein